MNGQKFALATIAGGIACFVGGFLIYGLALNDYMSAHMMSGVMKDPPDFVHLGLGQLAGGAMLTVVIGSWAKTGGAAEGLKIGAVLGFLMMVSFDLTMFATSNVMTSFSVVPVDILAGTVLNAIAGAVVGAVIGKR